LDDQSDHEKKYEQRVSEQKRRVVRWQEAWFKMLLGKRKLK
jgi:hypothetical protein